MTIVELTCISPNPQPTTINYDTNYIVQFTSNIWELCLLPVYLLLEVYSII